MRIARILTRLNLGGPARQALASDPILRDRGHEVRILTGRPEAGEGDLFDAFRARGLDAVRIQGLCRGVSPWGDGRAAVGIRGALARFRPDVLHTHASKAGTLGRLAVERIPARERVARVHTFHGHVLEGYFPAALSRSLAALERRLARRTDRVVAVSHATAEDLLRLRIVSEERLVVIPPGVELDALLAIPRPAPGAGELRRRLGAAEGDVLAGVVGRLAPVKRPLLALEVFALLRGRYPGLHLVYVGDGTERRALERGIAALGEDARRVHLLGAVEAVGEVWAGLDLALLTSRSEGLPVGLVEAAAAGLPAVATAVGGVEEVLVHERTGLLGAGADELAFGLARLLDDPGERRAMGERARLRVARRHGAGELARRLEELYAAVCGERGRDGGGKR